MTFVLFAAACLGHLVLMTGSHNWFYGHHLSKRVGDLVHLVHALLVLFFPAALLLLRSDALEELFFPSQLSAFLLPVTIYLWTCVLAGAIWLPAVTVYRLCRREPVCDVRSEVVDIAKQLGYRPVGEGHHAFLTRLPRVEVFHVEYAERTVLPPRLPAAWDGLTILHLTDLHFHGTPDRAYYRVVLDRCAEWMPDIVAITGDVADSDIHHRWIVPLLGRLRWRIACFAILGNHDHRHDVAIIRRRLRRLGMKVPENSWTQVDVRGEPMVVIGHEGPWLKPAPDLFQCPKEPFRLCLSHTPDNIRWARRHGIDLLLAGHVHGGQIRFPMFGSMLVPSVHGRRYDCGTFEEPPTIMHVSRGVSGEHPVRYNCLPEVTLITLRRARELNDASQKR
jgi:predicted MPP superfamily phosphohydrolase